MATVDSIRNRLIDKLLSIRNEKFLLALEELISSGQIADDKITFTEEQELMLQMSENDLATGRTISHSEFQSKINEWLKDQKS